MKRYERMTKEEIMDAYANASDDESCGKCVLKNKSCSGIPSHCFSDIADWLNDEVTIKKVPRFSLIKTHEDLELAFQKFADHCREIKCNDCKYSNYYNGMATTTNWHPCVQRYLADEVEVVE